MIHSITVKNVHNRTNTTWQQHITAVLTDQVTRLISWQPSTCCTHIHLTSLQPSDPLQSNRPIYIVAYQAATFLRTDERASVLFSHVFVQSTGPSQHILLVSQPKLTVKTTSHKATQKLIVQYPVTSVSWAWGTLLNSEYSKNLNIHYCLATKAVALERHDTSVHCLLHRHLQFFISHR